MNIYYQWFFYDFQCTIISSNKSRRQYLDVDLVLHEHTRLVAGMVDYVPVKNLEIINYKTGKYDTLKVHLC